MSITIETKAMRQQNILIVDDDVDLAANLRDILREEGYHVDIANSGDLALQRCRKSPLNLVISDIKLPDISGV